VPTAADVAAPPARGAGDAPPRRAVLSDGAPVLVEILGPADADDLLDLHARLSERDRWLRFGTLHPADLDGYVRRTLAGRAGELTVGARVRGRLLGAVQVLPIGGDVAEVAVVVDSAERARGVATVLLEAAAEQARRRGIERFHALVLTENGRMMRVLTDLGMPIAVTREGTALRVEVRLHADERYARAVEDRQRHAAAAALETVLRPASVAVVGVGRRPGSVGRLALRSILAGGFRGQVQVVHPEAPELEGVRCVPSLAELAAPDLVVVTVPAAAVDDVLRGCGERGARAALVLSSGIAAVPGLAVRLRDTAVASGLHLVGPNTVGVVGPDGPDGRFAATFGPALPPPGDIGLVTQSGGVAITAAAALERLGLGTSAALSVGDAVDLGVTDALAWFDEDPGTALVLVHDEGGADLRGLVRAARRLTRRLPVLALASGTSTAGRRAATSHTARAATPAAVREAVWTAGGIQGFADATTMVATAALLRGQPLPVGRRTAVLTNVGGTGVLVADALTAAGMTVDPLPDSVQRRLAAVLPALASTANPVDTSAVVSEAAFAAALRCLLEAPAVDAVVTVTVATAAGDPHAAVAAGIAAADTAGGATGARAVPVVDVRPTRNTSTERMDLAGDGPPGSRFVVSVQEPVVAARALAAAAHRWTLLHHPEEPPVVPAGVDFRAARAVVDRALRRDPAGGWLPPADVAALCEAAGLRLLPTVPARTAAGASRAARRMTGPFVVKGIADGVVHKADAGLLRFPLTDPAEVGRTVAEWAARWGARWRGAVVQPLAPPGDELLVGAVRDPAAGPVVAVGPGGRAADALGHRVHRLAPLSGRDATGMVHATGLFGTEHGHHLDADAVVDCVHRVGWLVDVLPELRDVDVNPLVVRERGATPVDVRMRLAVGDV
jgi:acyl-CoA synthetase (NDP forming)/GNAT superfamily N-acetyltransferase